MASTDNKNVEEKGGQVPVPDDFVYPTNSSPEPDPLADNPYLNREKCLLCQRDRTEDDESDSEDEELKIGPHNYALSQMSLWVCAKCKATLEEEERKGMSEPSFLNEEVVEPNALRFLTEMQMATGKRSSNEEADLKTCECEACKDRRQIEQDQDEENAKLQQCWVQLLHSIRDVYRQGKRCLSENGGKLDKHKQKQHVARLCARDSHQLYQRLESHAIDYILEVKVKLLQQLTSGHSTPEQAKAFMSLLLDEYMALCASSKILSDIFKQLEKEHLQRFSLNWELHDKHLFQNVIYSDPVVQNSVPMLITQLRIGAATKEPYVEDSYPCLLHKYLKFDDEMSVVAVVWRDCQLRIDQYTDEQTAIQAKQRMLREDWEFFSAQRKMLKDQIMKNHKLPHWPTKSLGGDTSVPSTVASSSGFEVSTNCTTSNNKCPEAKFSDAIRSVLDNPEEPKREPFTCPTCRTQICSCHECSINHLIGCGVLTPVDALFANDPPGTCGAGSNPFTITPSSIGYDISVKAPSFSSTDSSCDVDSDERGSDSDGQGSDCESTNSWDENNPNINLFEEFLKDAARKPPLLRKEDGELDKISPNNLSMPSPCQCHECKKPICTNNNSNNTSINGSSTRRDQQDKPIDTVPTTSTAKPAELHLYPHIHGSKTPIDPLRRAASELSTGGGSLATAQFKSLLQPQLYKLHNNPPAQSSALSQADKVKSRQKKEASPFFSNSNLQPCIKDQLKARQLPTSCLNSDPPYPFYNPLNGLKNGATALQTNAFSAYTGALKFPDLKNYPNTSRINTSTDALSAASSTFNPSAFSLDSMATDVPPTSNSASRALNLHNWTKMAQQVQPSCLLAYPNALDSDTPHEHTDECFKHLNTQLPLSTNRHTPVLHSTATPTTKSGGSEPKICSRVDRDLYNKLLLQSGGYTTPVTSAPASTIPGTPSEKLHIRPSSKDGHTASTCTARPSKKESQTSASNTSKTSAALKTSTGGSKPSTATSCHHAASSKVKPSPLLDPGKLSHRIEKPAAHKAPTSSGQNSGETEGGGSSPLSDDEDGGSCSGQSSSTSTSNQKDSKYCDCCYCEFFGHGQQTSLPTSKNYPEIRERLRQRLKKKQKEDNPCAKGRHDLVPIEQFKKMVPCDTADSRVAVLHNSSQKVLTPTAPAEGDSADRKGSLDCRNVEELVKYITGEVPDSAATSKADKKLRKKQKRAEQKARKLEMAKQPTNADSKTCSLNSDGDSDCDKVIAQQQGKSRHQPGECEKTSADSAPSLSKKVKGVNRLTRSESPCKRTPDDEVKGKFSTSTNISKNANSPASKPVNSRSAKGVKVNSRDMGAGDGPQKPSQLNNTRSPVKSDIQGERQHQRTHNNLQGSGDSNGRQHESARLNTRLHGKKSPGERRKGGNLIEEKGKGDGGRVSQMNMLNVKNSQPTGKDSSCKTSQRQQPDGQEDSNQPQRSQRLLNGKRTGHGSTSKKGGRGDTVVDDVFMPRDDEEVEDSFEKELNEFKRFVLSAPPPKAKIAANVNLKDLQLTKKKGVAC